MNGVPYNASSKLSWKKVATISRKMRTSVETTCKKKLENGLGIKVKIGNNLSEP